MIKRGKFIVVDGMDHSGKDTQINLLRGKLSHNTVFTREPGGTDVAERIREKLMDKDRVSSALEDLILFYASRVLHVREPVESALAAGKNVLSNRYDSSTWSYQINGDEQPELIETFLFLRNHLPPIYKPNAYFFLMVPPEVAYARGEQAAEKEKTKYDIKPLEYYRRTETGFKTFKNIAGNDSEVHYINAHQTREEVHRDFWGAIQKVLEE